jgi:hypothetical protein
VTSLATNGGMDIAAILVPRVRRTASSVIHGGPPRKVSQILVRHGTTIAQRRRALL